MFFSLNRTSCTLDVVMILQGFAPRHIQLELNEILSEIHFTKCKS